MIFKVKRRLLAGSNSSPHLLSEVKLSVFFFLLKASRRFCDLYLKFNLILTPARLMYVYASLLSLKKDILYSGVIDICQFRLH